MKEIWKEIRKEINIKTLFVILLSLIIFIIFFLLYLAKSIPKESINFQGVASTYHLIQHYVETNFTL